MGPRVGSGDRGLSRREQRPLAVLGAFGLQSLELARGPMPWASVGQPEASRVCHCPAVTQTLAGADWPLPPELDLQDLCTEEAESQELEGLWTSTYTFISLFLLSVSYSATVTVLKVLGCPAGWGPGRG